MKKLSGPPVSPRREESWDQKTESYYSRQAASHTRPAREGSGKIIQAKTLVASCSASREKVQFKGEKQLGFLAGLVGGVWES